MEVDFGDARGLRAKPSFAAQRAAEAAAKLKLRAKAKAPGARRGRGLLQDVPTPMPTPMINLEFATSTIDASSVFVLAA